MKKFYPEEYFRRSGYPFESLSQQKNEMVYFKNKQKKQQDTEFNRFNEELVYPTTESKVGSDIKSQMRRHDLDRLSAYSKQSRTPMGGDAASRSQRSKVSSMKYLRDAQSIQSKLRQQRKFIKPYQPDDALKLIEMNRMRRTLVKV